MRRDGGSVFPAHANTGDPNGPIEACPLIENARALISMMARSKCSNQRPDTLMQDHSPPDRRTSCYARPGQKAKCSNCLRKSAFSSRSGHPSVHCCAGFGEMIHQRTRPVFVEAEWHADPRIREHGGQTAQCRDRIGALLHGIRRGRPRAFLGRARRAQAGSRLSSDAPEAGGVRTTQVRISPTKTPANRVATRRSEPHFGTSA